MIKYYFWVTNINAISECINFVHRIYQQNTMESDNKSVLLLIISRMYIAIRILFVTFLLAAIVCILNPIIIYVIFSEVTMLLPIFLPDIDETTINGIIILACFHLIGIYIACIGSSGSDIGHMSLVLNGFAMSELISNEFRRLDKMTKKKNEFSVKDITYTVRNIILMHQDFRK